MANLRAWLTEKGFKAHSNAWILYQGPGEQYGTLKRPDPIGMDHPVLDQEFDDGYGSPEAPRITACDGDAMYIIGQYDGATWMERIPIKITEYLITENDLPYVGGG